MGEHHGAIIERNIKRSSFRVSQVALKLNVNRRTLYNWFSKQRLSMEIIHDIGLKLNYDFGLDIPRFNLYKKEMHKSELSLLEERNEVLGYKQKYLELLEAYNGLLEVELAKADRGIGMQRPSIEASTSLKK